MLSCVLGYLIGSIPTGVFLCKASTGMDPRLCGSGNVGATNAWRLGSFKLGSVVFICDFLKAFACAYFMGVFSGACAVVGQIAPIWYGFVGGKGVACFCGLLWGISPMCGFFFGITWLAVFAFSRVSAIASLSACALTSVFAGTFYDKTIASVIALITCVIIARHHRNIVAQCNI